MKNYINSYLRIFYENIVGDLKYNFQPIGDINLTDFYKNIILINDVESTKIITEAKNVDYGDNVLKLIDTAFFGQQLKKSDIITELNPDWQFFNKYVNSKKAERLPILIYKFDFMSDDCLKMFLHLNESYVNSIGKENVINSFHEFIEPKTKGFVNNLGNCIVLALNNTATLTTIKHELTHYFQIVLNVNVSKKITQKIKFQDIPELDLTKNEFKDLFNYVFLSNEFPAHLYVNIIEDLNQFYNKCFSQISKQDFINLMIKNILKFKKNIFKSEIGHLYLKYIDDKQGLIILILSAEYNIHFKQIIRALRNEFK